MDSRALAELVDFGATRGMDSLLVVRHGQIVTEAYYAPFTSGIRHRMNSGTKAVIGTLTAIALKKGLLDSLDHRVLDFFANRAIANLDERKEAITIQNLLDMTSGLDWVEGLESGRAESLFAMERSADWQQFVLDRPMLQPPGTAFYYNSGNAHILSAVLTKLTGVSAFEYAKRELFGPLGITDIAWQQDPQGVSGGGTGLYLQPRDMAKIGYLYLRNGLWEGSRILPTEWIGKVNHASIDMHLSWEADLWYTNLFWALPERNVYIAAGYHRQLIVVMPALDIVAVMTGTQSYSYHKLVDSIASSVISDVTLPANPEAQAYLANRIREAATEKPSPIGKVPEIASVVSGKVYRFAENAMHLKTASLNLGPGSPSFRSTYEPGTTIERFSGPIGLDGLFRMGPRRQSGIDVGKGTWLDDKTFAIDFQALGNDDAARVTLIFEGRSVLVSLERRDAPILTARGEANE